MRKIFLFIYIPMFCVGIFFLWYGYENLRYQNYMTNGEYEKAGNSFVADQFVVQYNIAYRSAQDRNLSRAVEHYRSALGLTFNPLRLSDVHYNIGVILETLEEAEGAAKEYEQALKINPHNREAKHNLERLYQLVPLKELEKDQSNLKQAPGTEENNQNEFQQDDGQGRSSPHSDI